MKSNEQLKAYLDDELSPVNRELVRRHLESSEPDRRELEQLERLSLSIRTYLTQPEPVGMAETLRALELAEPRVSKGLVRNHTVRWLAGVAACVLLIGLAGQMIPRVSSREADAGGSVVATLSPSSADSPSMKSLAQPGDGVAPASSGTTTANAKHVNGSIAQRVRAHDQAMESAVEPSPKPSTPRPGTPAMVQKTASLTVNVKNVAEAQRGIETMTTGWGGFVQSSDRSEAVGQSGEATLTLRVPVQRFELALDNIRALGDVVIESSSGDDVTADVVDMDARLKVLRTEETDYLSLLARARSISSIMAIRDKLADIRTDIETISSQQKATKAGVAFSTINVTLTHSHDVKKDEPAEDKGKWLAQTWSAAIDGLGSAAKLLAELFIFALVWSPLWIPTALVAAWIARKFR